MRQRFQYVTRCSCGCAVAFAVAVIAACSDQAPGIDGAQFADTATTLETGAGVAVDDTRVLDGLGDGPAGIDGADAGDGNRDGGAAEGGALEGCDPSFGASDACGGDLVGDWRYAQVCIRRRALDPLLDACPLAVVGELVHSAEGGWSFENDGSYRRRETLQVETTVVVPGICAALAGGCQALPEVVSEAFAGAAAVCTVDDTACDCRLSVTFINQQQGRYSLGDGTLTLEQVEVPDVGPVDLKFAYCVSGQVLRLHGLDSNLSDKDFTYVLEEGAYSD